MSDGIYKTEPNPFCGANAQAKQPAAFTPPSTQIVKTVREVRLERLVADMLPVVENVELGSLTSPELRDLIGRARGEIA